MCLTHWQVALVCHRATHRYRAQYCHCTHISTFPLGQKQFCHFCCWLYTALRILLSINALYQGHVFGTAGTERENAPLTWGKLVAIETAEGHGQRWTQRTDETKWIACTLVSIVCVCVCANTISNRPEGDEGLATATLTHSYTHNLVGGSGTESA